MNPRTWTALVGVRAGRPHPLVKRSLTRPTWSRLLPDRLHQRKLGMSDRSASSASAREQEHKRQKLENGNNQAGEGLKSGERTASAAEPPRIELTAVEKSLRQLLLDVAEEIDASTSSHSVGQDGQARAQPSTESEDEKLQLRFTGGWVRDKILGVESHDIDVSINKMTGLQFGLKMKEYLGKAENAAKHGVSNAGGKGEVVTANAPSSESAAVVKSVAGNLHKIAANPEKSKHLETVTTRVFNLDVDLVNLRKETYADDSRNPQMEFGTPEEDALRRDATINALFYNIHTEAVEDHTQRGLDDMKNKFIRTPLDPHQTFKDDPLRILRLVRFSVRLSYEIDPAARTAMRHDAIREALLRKISRERVGQEMEKMLKGESRPYQAKVYHHILISSLECQAPTPVARWH